MIVNSFRICNHNFKIVAEGFHLLPKSLKHSCTPNVAYVYFEQTLIISTVEDLPEINWDKVCKQIVTKYCLLNKKNHLILFIAVNEEVCRPGAKYNPEKNGSNDVFPRLQLQQVHLPRTRCIVSKRILSSCLQY